MAKQMTKKEAASILGSDTSSKEQKKQAAKVLGKEGGKESHGGGRPSGS